MTYKGFIFDIDGTLASTNRLIFDSFNYIIKKYKRKEYSDEEIVSFFGPPEDVLFQNIFNGDAENAAKDYYEFYEKKHNELVTPFTLVLNAAKSLKEKGYVLGIFTGKGNKTADITLRKLGVSDTFDKIYTGNDVINHKPHPEGILEFCKSFKLDNKEVLMIGDSASDIMAAKDANVDIALLLWDSYEKDKAKSLRPDFVFDSELSFYNFIKNYLKLKG